jgi:hypothetical protein
VLLCSGEVLSLVVPRITAARTQSYNRTCCDWITIRHVALQFCEDKYQVQVRLLHVDHDGICELINNYGTMSAMSRRAFIFMNIH